MATKPAAAKANNKAPNVSFMRPELRTKLSEYETIRDCLDGETAVKAAGTKYLPMPEESFEAKDSKAYLRAQARYQSYVKRAVFFNVTRRTLEGLVGQVMMRDPAFVYPEQMERVKVDASGTGVSLFQSAQQCLSYNLAYSRAGVFVDFTNTGNVGATAVDIERGEARPTIYAYSPFEIINWRVIERGSKEIVSLVVLLEGFPISDDGFEIKTVPQLRVLYLDAAGLYCQDVYRQRDNATAKDWNGKTIPNSDTFEMKSSFMPTDATGARMTEIPFWFIGSKNNDANPDNPNFYDIASLNIAHYRNSADFEEACFILGQPTPVVSGLTQQWLDEVLGGTLNFGSRGGIPLPADCDAKLLEASENKMIHEAMADKVEQMKSLGAKLVEAKTVQRTATETKADNASEGSVLSTCANNVSSAYLAALKLSASLMGLDAEKIEFSLNTDFDVSSMTPEDQRSAVDLWGKGAIAFSEMRARLRKGGIATLDDKEALAAITEEQMAQIEMTAAAVAAETAASGGPDTGGAE